MLDPTRTEPIYIQMAQWLEDEILSGRLQEEDKLYSQNQLAELFQVNPATAGKALTHLMDKGIAYSKRGRGTFVQQGALKELRRERSGTMLDTLLEQLVEQAKLLELSKEDVLERFERQFDGRGERDD